LGVRVRVGVRAGVKVRRAAEGGHLHQHVHVFLSAEGGLVAQLDGDRLQRGGARGCERL